LKATHKTNPGHGGGVSDGAWPTWQDELIPRLSKKGLKINILGLNTTHKSAKIYKMVSIPERVWRIQRGLSESGERGRDGLLSGLSNECPVKSSAWESRFSPTTS